MNRKKKIKQILIKKMKKASAKRAPKSTKPRYISKADREKQALTENDAPTTGSENETTEA